MGWLDGQVAIITGGGSGLGRALVDTFVEEGARVVVLQQSPGKIARLREETDPAWVQVVAGDARTYESNAATVAVALEKFGQLDCFIANAGVWDFGRTVTNSTPAELDAGFDEVFALNVKAALMGMAAAVEPLRASRGSFIMSLSNAALYPGGGGPLYVASKHAGVGLVKQL
ncbi:MAG: SDR family NAD(P)-dependent oxidoreductase, partial [Propionibacteriaceae bacterium]|nr:SDR family NAD(P)-dependent oxidoreductase [Propionibacteriaceae bacterium]